LTVRFRVFRSGRGEEECRYDVFEVEEWEGMTVLGGLFAIKEEQDGSLAFRYSCRGAVCGSCAVLINRVPGLACRTQVRDVKNGGRVLELRVHGPLALPEITWLPPGEVLVEPLPGFKVVRDLVVDIRGFFRSYRRVTPWFRDGASEPGAGRMSPEDREKVRPYANCILCGICCAACPVHRRDPGFLGPAALAKAWRFISDARFREKEEVLRVVDSPRGVWGCDTVYMCTQVCPKEVPPTQGITAMRRLLLKEAVKKALGGGEG
jgi:succinate dehydrogenase / fumarate reductase iron-sulfur subunit